VNPISAAVQNPAPKPDREVAPFNANGDTPQQAGTGRESAFGSVLRELSGAGTPSTTDTEVVKGKPDDADSDDAPPATAATAALPTPAPAVSATAMLANLLNIALPPAPTAAVAKAAAPVQDRSIAAVLVPATGSLSISAPGSTAAPASGSPSGSAPVAIEAPSGNTEPLTPQADATASVDKAAGAKDKPLPDSAVPTDGAARPDIAKVLQATAAKVEVLGRAVHFRPVVPAGAPAPEAANAGPMEPAAAEAEIGTANPQIARPEGAALNAAAALKLAPQIRSEPDPRHAVHFRPVVPAGAPAPDAANAAPMEPAAAEAEIGIADPQIARPEGVAMNAAAALKLAPQIRSEPDPRRAVAAAADREAEPEKPMAIAPAQGRAVSGVERAILASVGERGEGTASATGPHDGTGAAASLPAGSLPLIATAIKEELARATAAASQSRIHADPAANAVSEGPLRVLRIQLRPEDLGVVTVEMRLSNGQLETHLRASQPETAALLHKDTAILTDLLSHSSYQAEVIVGQARPTEAGAAPGGSQQQASPSFTDGGARPGNEGARQRQQEQRQAVNRREGERTDEAVRPRDGGVYL